MPLWTPPRARPDIPGGAKVLTPANRGAFYRYGDPAVWGALSDQSLHNPFRDFDFDERRHDVDHGWDHADAAAPGPGKEFHDRYAWHLARAHPVIGVPNSAIFPIVKSGRLKSQFETNRTHSAVFDTGERADVEHDQFGYPHGTPDHARPIYGTLTRHPFTDDSTASYGSHTLVLHKPHIWHRTTFCGSDSMDRKDDISPVPAGKYAANPAGHRHAVPLDHFGLSSAEAEGLPAHHVARRLENCDPTDLADMFWNRGDREHEFAYPETQYHGQVTVPAIRHVILRSPAGGPGPHAMHPDVAESAARLSAAGIPWVHTVGYRRPGVEDASFKPPKGTGPRPPEMPSAPRTASLAASGPRHVPQVAWRRAGGEAYLLGCAEAGPRGLAMGQVADISWGMLHPPQPVASILARGYWESCPHPVSSSDVMTLMRFGDRT